MARSIFLLALVFSGIYYYYTAWCSAADMESCVTVVDSKMEGNAGTNCCCSRNDHPCNTLELGLSCVQNNNSTLLLIKGHLHNLSRTMIFHNPANIRIEGQGIFSNRFDIIRVIISCSNVSGGLFFFNAFNVSISGLDFRNCRSRPVASSHIPTGGVVFINGSSVHLSQVILLSSDGYGAILSNICGIINVADVYIIDNKLGGLKIDFSCDCYRVVCFERMNVFGNGMENHYSKSGGGLSVEIATDNVYIVMKNISIWNNMARFGGGMHILLNGSASHNRVVISNSKVSYNQFHKPSVNKQYTDSRGGGVRIVFNTTGSSNTISFGSGCRLESNTAAIGAALSMVSSHVKLLDEYENNVLNISDSTIISNNGILGSAIHAEALRDQEDGFAASLLITDCSIKLNHLSLTTNQVIGTGVVYSHRIKLMFYGKNAMKGNLGSALCASSTAVHFSHGSVTNFESNSGFNGGAIAVTNLGYLVIHDGALLSFTNNSAVNKGGAIAVMGYGELNFDTGFFGSCFFKYSCSNCSSKLFFHLNTANGKSNSVFLPSTAQCTGSTNTSLLCDDKKWEFNNSSCHSQIDTLAAYIEYEQKKASVIQVLVYSGYQIKLPIKSMNDNNTDITSFTPFFASVDGNAMLLDPNSVFISDGFCTVYKKAATDGINNTLELYTLSSRLLHIIVEIKFLDCPPGYMEVRHRDFVKCECNNFFAIKCHPSKLRASLYDTFCYSPLGQNKLSKSFLPHVNNSSEYLFAQCLFATALTKLDRDHYYKLSNKSQYNSSICRYWNRTGLFCSECEGSTGVNVAGWLSECVHCSDKPSAMLKNILLYVIGKFLPVVLLFIVILFCRVNITSGSINLYTWFCQVVSLPENLIAFQGHFRVNLHIHSRWFLLLYFPLAIWNLNLMEFFFPKFCISRSLKIIHIITLDYLAALCPLLLIATSYVLIELHARGSKVVMMAWKPFGKCTRLFRKDLNVQHSIIDVFAAFIIISYSKFTNITFSLLVPNPVYDNNGSVVGYVAFADASVKYGSLEHIPFLILAIAVLCTVITFPPLLLLLYPFKCCDWINRNLSTRGHLAFTAFVDAFQGCYKDGTNGTRDCRFIGSLYFIVRVLGVVTRFFSWNTVMERLSQMLIVNCVVLIVAYFQPHKKPLNNKLDLLILFTVGGIVAIASYFANPGSIHADSLWLELIYLAFIFTPPFCFTAFVLYRILCITFFSLKTLLCAKLRSRTLAERAPLLQASEDFKSSDEGLPDRLINPQLY